MVRENKWRAARYGLDAEIIVDDAGHRRDRCAQRSHELVDELTPTARRLGCEDELALVPRILEHGASYQRQRRVAASAGGALRPVVDACWRRCAVGLPLVTGPSTRLRDGALAGSLAGPSTDPA